MVVTSAQRQHLSERDARGEGALAVVPVPGSHSAPAARHERRRLDASGRRAAPSVTAVVPALNEERNLTAVLPRLVEEVDELIVVDGHSADRTVDVARIVAPSAVIVEQPGRGKGDALRAGFAFATGDAVVMLDADGSMRVEEIPAFVKELREGAELVKGSRFLPPGGSDDLGWLHNLGNHELLALFNRLYGTEFSDLCYGYMAFWRRCLPVLDFVTNGFEVEAELNALAVLGGLRIHEVPSYELERPFGVSKLHAVRDGIRVARVIFGESEPFSSITTPVDERSRRAPRPAGNPGPVTPARPTTAAA